MAILSNPFFLLEPNYFKQFASVNPVNRPREKDFENSIHSLSLPLGNQICYTIKAALISPCMKTNRHTQKYPDGLLDPDGPGWPGGYGWNWALHLFKLRFYNGEGVKTL